MIKVLYIDKLAKKSFIDMKINKTRLNEFFGGNYKHKRLILNSDEETSITFIILFNPSDNSEDEHIFSINLGYDFINRNFIVTKLDIASSTYLTLDDFDMKLLDEYFTEE